MKEKFIFFGENVQGYNFKVINENEIRASAGIMFLFGIVSLFTIFNLKTLFWAELFSITFILEFIVRLFINPKYAPYMIFASLAVSNQAPNWVEAKPKKFAWFFGLILGLIMSYFIVFNIMSPIRLFTCVICLILLFMESSFGICLGCIIYKRFNIKLNKCSNDICKSRTKIKISKFLSVLFYIILFIGIFYYLKNYKYEKNMVNAISHKAIKKNDCEPPQWAIDIGHEAMWKKHHNCK
jgi:hypothetical protein